MEKRKTFYVVSDVFKHDLSAYAIAAFAYLSYCCNRQGECFPSVATIAQHTGMSRSTAHRALDELRGAGLILSRESYSVGTNGKCRQQANRYRVMGIGRGVTDEQPPVRETDAPGVTDAQEINNDSNNTMGTSSFSPYNTERVSEGARKRFSVADAETAELNTLIAGLELELFADRSYARAVETAIRTMFRAESITVKGRTVPQSAVRDVLRQLTTDHIDYVAFQLSNLTEDVTNGSAYLCACLYNAPMDMMIRNKRAYGK